MSGSCKPKPGCFESDIRRLLLAAEAGQKADILAYSSGHLGPHSLNHGEPHREKKQSFWRMSQSHKETPKPLQSRTKVLTCAKGKEMKELPSEFSTGTALVESEVRRSRQHQATESSSHAEKIEDKSPPKIVHCSSHSLPVQPTVHSLKKTNSSFDPGEKQQIHSDHSDWEGLNNKGQQKTKQCGRQFIAKQELSAGTTVVEMHEKKLQKELKKLSAQSWPSRDRLVVFSDVFDDVCEGSPVFGRILREIKTDYDMYVNHMMASQTSLDMSAKPSLEDLCNSKVKEMELKDAEKEVCRLEQEARRVLEENKRVRHELQNIPAIIGLEDSDIKNRSLSGLQGRGTAISSTDSIQTKRLQVVNMWREIQQLEEEIKEKLVSSATTKGTENHIKDIKTEIMKLIASNHCLKNTNKDLENNINMVLNREKASKALRRMIWDEIHCDLQTETT